MTTNKENNTKSKGLTPYKFYEFWKKSISEYMFIKINPRQTLTLQLASKENPSVPEPQPPRNHRVYPKNCTSSSFLNSNWNWTRFLKTINLLEIQHIANKPTWTLQFRTRQFSGHAVIFYQLNHGRINTIFHFQFCKSEFNIMLKNI